jgi:hypothetical protein
MNSSTREKVKARDRRAVASGNSPFLIRRVYWTLSVQGLSTHRPCDRIPLTDEYEAHTNASPLGSQTLCAVIYSDACHKSSGVSRAGWTGKPTDPHGAWVDLWSRMKINVRDEYDHLFGRHGVSNPLSPQRTTSAYLDSQMVGHWIVK